MERVPQTQPTKTEFRILSVLWRNGPSTVRQVYEQLGSDAGYTTVLKLMQIMHEKGFLFRDESKRSHLYQAALPESQTKGRVVHDLIDRVFGGSARELILQALSSKKSSREDLAAIRQMIEGMERKK